MNLEKIIDILFNGFSIAGIILGLYLLFSGLQLKYVKTYFLKAWLIIIVIQIVFYLLNLNAVLPNYLNINYFAFPLCMLHMPLFYLAIVDLTKIRRITGLEIALHVSFYLVYVAWLVSIDISTVKDILVINGFINLPPGLSSFTYAFVGIPLAVVSLVYSILCLIAMFQYKKLLKANLSNTDKYQLHWITYLVWAIILLFILIYLVIIARTDFMLTKASITFKLVNILLFFFLLAFGVKYQKQLIYFLKNEVVPLEIPAKTKYVNSGLTNENMVLIAQKMNLLIKSKELYLDEYLTLQKVADVLEESPQSISQTLNDHLSTNFYTYINTLRLDLAENKLQDPSFSKLSIMGIAMDSGFKSKSTFYKLFKQKTGKTPAEYRNLE